LSLQKENSKAAVISKVTKLKKKDIFKILNVDIFCKKIFLKWIVIFSNYLTFHFHNQLKFVNINANHSSLLSSIFFKKFFISKRVF